MRRDGLHDGVIVADLHLLTLLEGTVRRDRFVAHTLPNDRCDGFNQWNYSIISGFSQVYRLKNWTFYYLYAIVETLQSMNVEYSLED